MSTTQTAPEGRKANERPKYAAHVTQARGPMGHGAGSGEKAVSFVPSLKRLAVQLRPERVLILVAVVISAAATLGNALAPMVLAQATDLLWNGVTAGTGVDTSALLRVILQALAIYGIAGVVLWAAGLLINDIVQRTVFRMRRDLAAKLDRLPIKFFDAQPRGELLSRVTNDIDNVAQSMQQTLAQMLNNIFTVIGVVAMMFVICLLYTSPSPRDRTRSRMPSSA